MEPHTQPERDKALVRIKVLHTLVWAFFVGCIVAIPIAGLWNEFRWAAMLAGLVVVECLVFL